MSAPLDYISTLVDTHWSLWEASQSFDTAVRVGSRLKIDKAVRARVLFRRAPAEFPNVKVEPVSGFLGRGAPRSFGGNVTTATPAYLGNPVMPGQHQFSITVAYDRPALSDETPLEALMKSLLMAKWPTLGIPWVSGFEFRETRRDTKDGPARGTLRTVVEMTNTISIRPRLADLVGS